MTLVQMQPRPAGANLVQRTAVELVDAAGPQVCDDMSVEVALAVMTAARTGRLVVCDQDDQYTGLVTRSELTAVRDSSAYTDRVRLRDILDVHGSFTSPVTTRDEGEYAKRYLRLGVLPVVDMQGSALGVVGLSH
ncbi:CBS domain-containing protein [Streptomyces europaeiscabiei]|uniref:CBS domain-containing protein n=1 Tax=Streptomyces europaeiscabiei TaxID=146819 RepID=A0ABU4NKW9_9ACTN|nr:CBS domain-containing protein [Streptomyces europaeiscabiei]MDX2759787.1 CBS domain-containing protein [Streptomyces europaeiscabiei]MDX3545636.1 CBS domain-containing protein [Streptomyces europaeiscabiei]MDX3554966.1 CBS domain-containing protein [Streptomyces europaeiscabiei]MDX3670839.1 CBS domain-containing protein [Streptomyces europaeiscabiei]MDX3702767.1 CBS domain-containing protein [Streptomyces europaeiscabiei]